MGYNLFANVPASVVAKQTASFVECGVNEENFRQIILAGIAPQSYRPGSSINPIQGFVKGENYYVTPKLNLDFSEIIAGPLERTFTSLAPLVLNQQDFQNIVFFDNIATNSKSINAFAHVEFETDADTVTITLVSQLFGRSLNGANGVSLYINDVYTQRLIPTANDALQNFVVDLSELEGTNRIRIVTSTTESGTQSVVPVKITFPTWSKFTPIRSYKKPNQLVTVSDSIGVAVGSSIPEQLGYVARLRVLKPSWDIVPIGSGGTKFTDFFDSTNLPITRQRLKIRFEGTVKKRLYIALGTNDYAASVSVATIQGLLLAALDAVHTDFPDIKVFVQTPTSLSSETSAMTNIRTGIATTVNSRNTFCTLVNGPSMVATSKLVDGTHPNDAGYLDMTNYLITTTLFN